MKNNKKMIIIFKTIYCNDFNDFKIKCYYIICYYYKLFKILLYIIYIKITEIGKRIFL